MRVEPTNPEQSAEIECLLKKIIADENFSSSQRCVDVLTYMIEMTLKGEVLKEHIIGEYLLGDKFTLDNNSGIVRVYMSNIRKKLALYYDGNGANDTIRFTLPKRSYQIIIEQVEVRTEAAKKSKLILGVIPLLVVLIVGISLAINALSSQKYCWVQFMNSDSKNICIIADHCVLNTHIDSLHIAAISRVIGNANDYKQMVNRGLINPREIKLADFGLYSKAIPLSVNRLSQWFANHDSKFDIINESDLSYDQIRKSNLIYIGQFKTMNVSFEILLKESRCFSIDRLNIYYTMDGKRTTYKPSRTQDRLTEYTLVSYFPLENGHYAIYIISNNDVGVTCMVDNFTSEEFLNEFYKQLPSKSSCFNALFKVESVKRINTSCELIELEVL